MGGWDVPQSLKLGDLEVIRFELGWAATNTYLVGHSETGAAVVIDPAWEGEMLAAAAEERGWRVEGIWITHGHFDHFGGVAGLARSLDGPVPVAMHPADLPLWKAQGGASFFGIPDFDPGPEPSLQLQHGMQLFLADYAFEVRHTPGHAPGHVIFWCPKGEAAFCGDLIFRAGVGRTDLPGGDWDQLLHSIREHVFTLPGTTRLLPGHGPLTTVEMEQRTNPFVATVEG
ncbi:MAG TPA: MBL fold metallo-hydrolase [Chloroflexi bacterium]|nr:MBL fold metallo-hydrolase [Chloroflexota bacterium]